uniref:Uncharacterized protein n=1 Tax=Plectus sambesii TaxID=2011161 RepID=A0A914XFI8_9BILA
MALQGPPQINAAEISEKLQQEEERLKNLQENLNRSRQLKESMLGILDSFEKRLEHLEATVLPLYEHTGKMQRKQQNITKTLKSIDATLGFYTTAHEMDSIIRESSPADNLDSYIKQMDKLRDATKFFSADRSYGQHLENMKATFELGCHALEKEYRDLLNRNSMPAKPLILVECLDENFEVIASRLKTIDTIKDVDRLKTIGQWLLANHSNADFLNAYAEIRGANMLRTLQSLNETRRVGTIDKVATGGRPPSPKGDRRASGLVREAFRMASRAYGTEKGYLFAYSLKDGILAIFRSVRGNRA